MAEQDDDAAATGSDAPDATDDPAADQARLDAIADADRARVAAANQLDRDRSMIAQGRKIGGMAGAAMAGAMIAMRDIVEQPKRDDGQVVVDAPSEPHDVDRDGVALSGEEIGGDHDIAVPAQPRRAPVVPPARRTSRRRR